MHTNPISVVRRITSALLCGTMVAVGCTRVRDGAEVRTEDRKESVTAKVSGATAEQAPLELTIPSDPVVATAGASFQVPVRLRNVGSAPIMLMFRSSCSFGVAVESADGRDVARPEAICLQVIREPTLEPGGVMEDSVSYVMGEPGVVRLEPGSYRLIPVLKAMGGVSVRVQSSRLEVRRP